jgi:hypothetical protein
MYDHEQWNWTNLSSTSAARDVEGDNLSTYEVVSGSNIGRDLEEDLTAVGVHQVGTPLLRTLTVDGIVRN